MNRRDFLRISAVVAATPALVAWSRCMADTAAILVRRMSPAAAITGAVAGEQDIQASRARPLLSMASGLLEMLEESGIQMKKGGR